MKKYFKEIYLNIKMETTYHIGNLKFKFQKNAIDHTRNIITKAGPSFIGKENENFNFFMDLLKNQPDNWKQIGAGVEKFQIIRNKADSGFEVIVHREDQTIATFSWRNCAAMKHKTEDNIYKNAARNFVQDDINKFRESCIGGDGLYTCKKCNIKGSRLEVDHMEPEFRDIYANFIKSNENEVPDYLKNFKFAQQNYVENTPWELYHREHAKLQMLCKVCNGAKAKSSAQKITANKNYQKNKEKRKEYAKKYYAAKRKSG